MPDDNLFDDPKDTDKGKAKDDAADKGGEPDAAAQLAALEKQVADLQASKDAGVGNTQQLAAAIEALQKQIEKLEPEDADPPPADAKSEAARRQAAFEKFYGNMDGYIAERAQDQARQLLGPYLRLQAEQRRDELLESQQARIDAIHGAGTWEKHFSKDVAATFKELPLELQSSRTHVQRAVEAIYGKLHLDDTARAELTKGRDTVSKAKASPPGLMDGGRPAPKPDTLSDEEQAFLASLKRSGMEMDSKAYLAAKGRGNTEESWRAAKSAGKR